MLSVAEPILTRSVHPTQVWTIGLFVLVHSTHSTHRSVCYDNVPAKSRGGTHHLRKWGHASCHHVGRCFCRYGATKVMYTCDSGAAYSDGSAVFVARACPLDAKNEQQTCYVLSTSTSFPVSEGTSSALRKKRKMEYRLHTSIPGKLVWLVHGAFLLFLGCAFFLSYMLLPCLTKEENEPLLNLVSSLRAMSKPEHHPIRSHLPHTYRFSASFRTDARLLLCPGVT